MPGASRSITYFGIVFFPLILDSFPLLTGFRDSPRSGKDDEQMETSAFPGTVG